MLKCLGNTAYSYTFTDISSGFFNKAEQIFTDQGASGTIHFKTLDVEKDIAIQGFVEHSYDLILASLVLHATQDLEETMRNVRRLLKPGGYLVMLEITDNYQTRFGFIFGSLSGWWRSIDGRLHSPCVDINRWQAILLSNGFSGVDTVASSDDPLAYPFSVIVSQAVDEEIAWLREPLKELSLFSDLTIFGDFSNQFSLPNRLYRVLAPHYSAITTTQLTVIDDIACKSQNVIFDAQEIESILGHDLKGYIATIERLFVSNKVRNILWITTNGKTGDGHTGMGIGIAKSLRRQHPHIQLLCLNLDVVDDTTVAIAAAKVLSIKKGKTRNDDDGRLWSAEYDVHVVEGQELIPRLVPDIQPTDRHRSGFALVTRHIDLTDHDGDNIELTVHKASGRFHFDLSLSYFLQCKTNESMQPRVAIGVIYSLQTALYIECEGSTGNLFLIVGTVLSTGQVVVGFCADLALVVTTWASWIVPWNFGPAASAARLMHLGMNIVARSLLSNTPRGTTVVIFEASVLTSALLEEAKKRDIELLFLSANPSAKSPELFIHPRTTSRMLRTILPKNPCYALNIGDNKQFATIVDYLPRSCDIQDTDDILSAESREPASIVEKNLATVLNTASAHIAEQSSITTTVELGSISGRIAAELSIKERLSVLNWSSGSVPVQVQPVGSLGLFSPRVTYWIVGLTAEYTLSLSEWMEENGARFIIILSSQPCEESEIGNIRSSVALIDFYNMYVPLTKAQPRLTATDMNLATRQLRH